MNWTIFILFITIAIYFINEFLRYESIKLHTYIYKDNLRFGVHHRNISSTFINRCDKNWLTFVGIAVKDSYPIWWLPQACLCWWFKSANNYGYDTINRFVRANTFMIKMMTARHFYHFYHETLLKKLNLCFVVLTSS